jgi:hypothetical protein
MDVPGWLAGPAVIDRRWAAHRRNSVKRVLKVPSDEQPTPKQTSVTLRSRAARAIRRSPECVVDSPSC